MIRPMCDRCTWDFLFHRKVLVAVKFDLGKRKDLMPEVTEPHTERGAL